ncbi:mitochondrial import inner membrane translocase subunit Tim10 B-like [Rhopilema esculentum]|uniref:mitochondrial import inner membrane translocase subunit Tim10 B-like n=1 Tax=Rhopilema esculentum TaxID=499914 RepID=UPI0031D83FC7
MAAQGAFSKESLAAQNYKEFILLYNKIAEKCFQDCVTSFNETTLTENEIECTNKCSGKMVNVNHRLMAVFMEIGPPVDKQLGLSGAGMGLM